MLGLALLQGGALSFGSVSTRLKTRGTWHLLTLFRRHERHSRWLKLCWHWARLCLPLQRQCILTNACQAYPTLSLQMALMPLPTASCRLALLGSMCLLNRLSRFLYDIRNFTDEETLLAQSLAGLCARQRPLILKGSQYGTSKPHAVSGGVGRLAWRHSFRPIHHATDRAMSIIKPCADLMLAAFASLQSIFNVTIQPVNTIARLLASVAAANMMPTCYVEYSTFQVRPVTGTPLRLRSKLSPAVISCQG